MPFRIDPPVQLDLEAPLRIEVFVPLHLLHRFHPSLEPVTTRGNIKDVMTPQNPLNALRPTALIIAELVSNEIFGSTQAIREDFYVIGHWERDGTLESIFFFLHHGLRTEDIGLNPEYIRLAAHEEDGGGLVLRPRVLTGERRRVHNEQFEGPPPLELASL
jgi:hypothetical protein